MKKQVSFVVVLFAALALMGGDQAFALDTSVDYQGDYGVYASSDSGDRIILAGRRGGGSSRGGGGKAWGGKKTTNQKPSGSGWGGKKAANPSTQTSKPVLKGNRAVSKSKTKSASKADQAAYSKAKASGKVVPNKAEARGAFKKDKAMAGKYPSKYDKKPATRPSHIPQTYSVNGQSVNVTYNVGHGGYGYMNPGTGLFAAYIFADMASDAMMMNAMQSNGYHVGGPPVIHRSGFTALLASIMTLLLICCGAVILFKVVST